MVAKINRNLNKLFRNKSVLNYTLMFPSESETPWSAPVQHVYIFCNGEPTVKNGCCDETCICLKQGSMKWKAKMYICARCFETQPFLPLCTFLDATTQILPLWLQTCTPIGKPYFLLIVGCHNRFPLSYEKKGICLHNKKYTCFFFLI